MLSRVTNAFTGLVPCVQTGNPMHRRAIVAFIGFCIYSLGNGLLILALGRYENDHPVQTRTPRFLSKCCCRASVTNLCLLLLHLQPQWSL